MILVPPFIRPLQHLPQIVLEVCGPKLQQFLWGLESLRDPAQFSLGHLRLILRLLWRRRMPLLGTLAPLLSGLSAL